MNVFIILIALLIIFLIFTLKSNIKKKYSFDEAFIQKLNRPIARTQYNEPITISTHGITVEEIVELIETKLYQEKASLPTSMVKKIRHLMDGHYSFNKEYLDISKLERSYYNLRSQEVKHGIIYYAITQWIMYSHPNTFDDFIIFMKNCLAKHENNDVRTIRNEIEQYTRYECNF